MDWGRIRRLVETHSAAPPSPHLDLSLSEGSHVAIVDDGSAWVVDLIQALRHRSLRPILLQYRPLPRPAPTIDLDLQDPGQFESIVSRLCQLSGALAGILWLNTQPLDWDQHWFPQARAQVLAAIAMAKGVATGEPIPFCYWITAQGGRFGQGADSVDALAVGLESLVHPLRMELPQISFRSIDLDPHTPSDHRAQQILTELAQPDQPFRTAYGWQQGTRVALGVQEIPAPSDHLHLQPGAVVVFAGGARGIGAFCAQALAQQVRGTQIFLGRTTLTDEILALSQLTPAERQTRADAFITAYKADHPGCSPREPREAWRQRTRGIEAAETLNAIRSLGSQADYFALDVRDHGAVLQVLGEIKERYGRPDALIHVAGLGGVETDRMLSRKDWPVVERVVETKVSGAVNLLQVAELMGIPLFVGFGSIASRFGNSGQVDYACANALLAGIVRAHNAQERLPLARIIGWGAWDEVGMAVSGPTKQMLASQGVEFIAPEQGGHLFVQELCAQISPSHPTEVYLSPNWAGLDDLLLQGISIPSAESIDLTLRATPSPALLGPIVDHQPGVSLRAEHELHPRSIPFLDDHRYDGTAWVPAVLGMEVAVEGATQLHPGLQAFALREIRLKKAIRLVRDEPALLITAVQTRSRSGQEVEVAATISGSYKGRTWVFAEMIVVLSSDPTQIARQLQADPSVPPLPTPQSSQLHRWSHGDLYPCAWLPYQVAGPTFQVVESMSLQGHRAEGQLRTQADLSGCLLPITLIDGMFQVYGVAVSTLQGSWSGPPLYIGELSWQPGSATLAQASVTLQIDLADKQHFPLVHICDPQGQVRVRLHRADQGGISLKALSSRQSSAAIRSPAPGPYLGQVIELDPGQSLKAEQRLDPVEDVLLRDHQFNGYVVVPAVYFMEVVVEAAAHLLPDLAPCELRNFQIHQMLHLLRQPQLLRIQAQRIGDNQVQVQVFSRPKTDLKCHAEGIVVQGSAVELGSRSGLDLSRAQVRDRTGLYPHRFPNGPIFQVIERMALGPDHTSQSTLRRAADLPTGCRLPITLLDGAFQVDSATRSGFDRTSGLPKQFGCLRWKAEAIERDAVVCLSSTQDDRTDTPGELCFVDQDHQVILQLSDIILTPPLPYLRSQGRP